MLRSGEVSIGPQIKNAPDRLIRPRIEASPSPEVNTLAQANSEIGLRVLRNITENKRSSFGTNQQAFENAVLTNEGGLGTLTQIDRLRSQPNGEFLPIRDGEAKGPMKLDQVLTVTRKDAAGNDQHVLISEVISRNGDTFTCTQVDSNGNPQMDVSLPASEVLRAQIVASEPQLQQLLSDPSVPPDDKAVVETFVAALKGDTTQLEEATSDPAKKSQMEQRFMEVASRNGMLTRQDGLRLINMIAPENPYPPGQPLDASALTYIQKNQAKREQLLGSLGEDVLLSGDTVVRLLAADLPTERAELQQEIAAQSQKLEGAKTKEEQSRIREKLNELTDLQKGLDIFEQQAQGVNGGKSEMATWIDALQEGNTADDINAETALQAIRSHDMDKFLENLFPYIPNELKDSRLQELHKQERKQMLKKHGKISLAVLLGLMVAGSMASSMFKDDNR